MIDVLAVVESAWTWLKPLLAPAVIGAAIATLCMQWLQFRYWRRERRIEIQLRVIEQFNRLSADYITAIIDAETTGVPYRPPNDFFRDLQMVRGNCRALFRRRVFKAYMRFERMVSAIRSSSVDEVVTARDEALTAMYGGAVS